MDRTELGRQVFLDIRDGRISVRVDTSGPLSSDVELNSCFTQLNDGTKSLRVHWAQHT